jgi:hypothetical protein
MVHLKTDNSKAQPSQGVRWPHVHLTIARLAAETGLSSEQYNFAVSPAEAATAQEAGTNNFLIYCHVAVSTLKQWQLNQESSSIS